MVLSTWTHEPTDMSGLVLNSNDLVDRSSLLVVVGHNVCLVPLEVGTLAVCL